MTRPVKTSRRYDATGRREAARGEKVQVVAAGRELFLGGGLLYLAQFYVLLRLHRGSKIHRMDELWRDASSGLCRTSQGQASKDVTREQEGRGASKKTRGPRFLETASIPRAFGYAVSSMRTAAAALQRYFQILELKWVLARGIDVNKRGHLYFRFLSRACAISRWCFWAGRVFPAELVCVALEQRNRVLMSTHLHRVVLCGEILQPSRKLGDLFLLCVIERGRDCGF